MSDDNEIEHASPEEADHVAESEKAHEHPDDDEAEFIDKWDEKSNQPGFDTFIPVTPFQAEVIRRLDEQDKVINGLKDGVNTIGGMMNSVAEAFDQIMQKVNQGGIGALLGGFLGGKNDG